MNKMIKIAIAAGIMAAMTVTSFAQGAGPAGGQKGGAAAGKGQGKEGRRGGMMNMDAEVLAKLNLTEAQKKDIKALKETTAKKMKELFEASKGDREGMREKFKPIMDGYQTGLKKILTPAQLSEFEKAMKEMRKKMGNKGPGGPAGAGSKGPGGPAGAGGAKGKGKGGGGL